MIEHINLIRNVGLFDNHSPPAQTGFSPFTLLYGENARGKTTMAAVFRSLATGDPQLVLERHRLGAQHPPHIAIRHTTGTAVFQNGVWSQSQPAIAIFDDAFVSANVCSGIELQTAHRQNLHELILGAQGVALNAALQGHVARIEEHNVALRSLADDIPAVARGPYKVDAFCDIEPDVDIDRKIQEAERRLAAARSADLIRQKPGFQTLGLPDFDIDEIDGLLGRALANLENGAAERVRTHVAKLGRGGETWVSEGMPRAKQCSNSFAQRPQHRWNQ